MWESATPSNIFVYHVLFFFLLETTHLANLYLSIFLILLKIIFLWFTHKPTRVVALTCQEALGTPIPGKSQNWSDTFSKTLLTEYIIVAQ